MKRWKLKLKDKEYEPIVYAKTETDAITCFKDEVVESVTLYKNRDYLSYINKMLKNAMLEGIQHRNNNCDREWYKTDTAYGVLRFRLIKDCNDDSYFDYTDYQFVSNDCKVLPCTYEMSTPQKVCEKYFSSSPYCEIYSYRLYGEPKLVKPVELKGIKSSFIVDFIPNKCKCHCFVKDNDLWIKHRDFFSKSHRPAPKDIGTPLTYRLQRYFNCDKNYLDKFMYPDSWGSIVLRNEAWIVFHNIKNFVLVDKIPPVVFVENMFLNTDLMKKSNIYNLSNEWDRFFENTLKTYVKYLKERLFERLDRNGKSIYTTLGASNHTDKVRETNDYYATEPKAAELLLQVEDFATDIWECACGECHLSKVFEAHGYNVKSTDLIYRDGGMSETFDFLAESKPNSWNGSIITNPPYKYAYEFVEKALDTVTEGNKVAMFLKLQFLEGKKRRKLFDTDPPQTVYVSSSRLLCAKNGEFDKMRADGGSAVAYAWYVWQKGYKGDTIVKWIN